jgi:hypothetical protein
MDWLGIKACIRRVPCGTYTRRTMQRIYLQARVVSKHNRVRRMTAVFDRLDASILFECGSVFGRRIDALHSGESGKRNITRMWLGGYFEVTKFSGICGRDVQ